MRNKIVTIVFLLLIIVLIIAIFWGIEIGNFKILSVSNLESKNGELNKKIEEASNLTTIKYPETIDTLEKTYEEHNIQKQKYEELSGFSGEDEEQVYETKQYDIGYLWKIVGKYATSNNLTIELDVKKASGQDLYDLYFNVTGEYVNTSEFIKKIENNSDLSFRIYDFKMTGSSETVSSSFTVKNISIDPSTISASSAVADTDTSVDDSTVTDM